MQKNLQHLNALHPADAIFQTTQFWVKWHYQERVIDMQSSVQATFFSMLANYHEQTYPFALIGFVLGFSMILLFLSAWSQKSKAMLYILAFLWAWNGLILFTYMTGELAPALYALQGLLFPLQGVLLGYFANSAPRCTFGLQGVYGKVGLCVMFTALFIYPIIGNLFGHNYPAAPVFPEPCPITIFTFGLLLTAYHRVPTYLVVIPFFWSLMGIVAVFKLGVEADAIEVIIGVASIIALTWKNRQLDSTM